MRKVRVKGKDITIPASVPDRHGPVTNENCSYVLIGKGFVNYFIGIERANLAQREKGGELYRKLRWYDED